MKVITSIMILFLFTNCVTQENCTTISCEPPQKKKKIIKKDVFFTNSKIKIKKKRQKGLFEKKILPHKK